jgi:hypothetical protein
MTRKIIIGLIGFVIIIYLLGFFAHLVWGHEHGHAEGIRHLTGYKTPATARRNYVGCPGQNKLLGYYDLDKDGAFDMCVTMWQEHEEIHIIISEPDESQHCECEGYLWLDNDTQETR